ncbi:hypothetical protein OMAG_000440 [Candidatus Omnitrophus magneticus]|uniref:Uncharacterized protein n=1 Tax=Candidatus Omnitrophus magneticus TaxID=1609969 RepID=A0A0F0CQU4_9BACT|nr:hypothetical protein OMAG_000440 [Candidatus Omnitrophus magneticus]
MSGGKGGGSQMKILIKKNYEIEKYIYLKIEEEEELMELVGLIRKKEYKKIIEKLLASAKNYKEFNKDCLEELSADFILTENNIHWNLP